MKRIYLIAAAVCAVMAASCDKYDDTQIKDAISSLEDRVAALESLNDEVDALKSIVEGKITVSSCVESDGICTVTLSDGKVIKVNTGVTELPVVTVIVENNRNYWGYYKDGKVEPLLYNGKKVEVTSLTPAIKVNEENRLEISVDGGKTWTESETTLSGGLFSKVDKLDDCIVMTLADGFTEFRVPFVEDSIMQFFSFSGKQYFTAGESKDISVEMVGVDNFTVTERPDGWKASLSEGKLKVTAPAKGTGETSGVIKMLGLGDEPMIAQVYVEVGTAPCTITIAADKQVTIKPVTHSCFYGAALLDDFDPKAIAKELSGVSNPMLSRYPYTGTSTAVMPLSDLISEVVLGETYVVWAYPVSGGDGTEAGMMYEAVSSIGVNYEVSDVNFENARVTVSVKGTDTYYLIPMEEEITLDNVIEDLTGSYAATYDRFKHTASFRGPLSDIVENPMTGVEYELLVLPVKLGTFCTGDAVTFKVKLADFVLGGDASVTLSETDRQYKSLSVNVSADNDPYKVIVSTVSAEEYEANGYASDDALLGYLKTISPVKYSGAYTYKAQNLESGSAYWIVAVAVDRNGYAGTPARLELSTIAVQYSDVTLAVGEVAATLNSAVIPVTVSGGEIVSCRYLFMSSSAGGYWYNTFIDDEQAAYEALIYGTVEHTDIEYSKVGDGIAIEGLEFGTNYIFCVIGYDKDGKITNMGKTDFSPTVGKVVKSSDAKWTASKPDVSAVISGNTIRLTVTFPNGCNSYVLTRMSSEEYEASMPGAERLKTDYVLGHNSAIFFDQNISSYNPGWYISADKPYILIAWEDENGWYEPLVYDSGTGNILNK